MPSNGSATPAQTRSLTFVTTCKGRLEHLRQTLPLLASQPGTRCIVVDYACPDRTADWVETHFPQVRTVRVPEATGFNPSRARNLGVAAATSEVICLIDADVRIKPGFAASILAGFDPRKYYLAAPLIGDISGTIVCARAAFEFVDGYDEACSGWGGEDLDLYERFALHGLRRGGFAANLLDALPHSDALRTTHHAVDKQLSNSVNLIYSHIKLDLMRLSGNRLPLDYRQRLHAQVHAACVESRERGTAVRIEVPYADIEINFCSMQTCLAYTITL